MSLQCWAWSVALRKACSVRSDIPSYLGLVWLAKAGVGPGAPDMSTTNALRTFLLMPVPSVPVGTVFFAVGSTIFSYLLLRGRMVPVSIAWLGVFASGLLAVVLPLQARRFLHGAADRILPVAAGPRIPNRARAVAAHQRCRHTGDAMSRYTARCVNQCAALSLEWPRRTLMF